MPADRGQHRDDDHNKADRGDGRELKLIFCLHTHSPTRIAAATAGECVFPASCFDLIVEERHLAAKSRRFGKGLKNEGEIQPLIFCAFCAFLRRFLIQDFSSRAVSQGLGCHFSPPPPLTALTSL